MNPYDKAFKISMTLHVCVAAALCLMAAWNVIFRPRPAAIFTVMAPPAGLIAGGPSNSPMPAPENMGAPQGPKLPSPAPAETAKKAPTPKVIPTDDFLDSAPVKPKAVKKKTSSKSLKKESKPELISYAEWVKEQPQKAAARAKTKAHAQAIPAAAPSFEQNMASRLDRRIQEEGQQTAGVGLSGAPGSGTMGSGTPGATQDEDALYAGTLYSYLNSVWEEPKEVGNVHLYASVDFTVSKAGLITSWKITRGSGSESFDKSVAKVFKQIKQVSTPPSSQEYRLSVTFETRDS